MKSVLLAYNHQRVLMALLHSLLSSMMRLLSDIGYRLVFFWMR